MTREQEKALIREMGELQEKFSLCDTSEENKARGRRIREIREELNLVCKPRKDRRPTIITYR